MLGKEEERAREEKRGRGRELGMGKEVGEEEEGRMKERKEERGFKGKGRLHNCVIK